MNRNKLPRGFVCRCGTRHNFHPWVYAHWEERLVFTCPVKDCGVKWDILSGIVRMRPPYTDADLFFEEKEPTT